jgi:hypothetical protein
MATPMRSNAKEEYICVMCNAIFLHVEEGRELFLYLQCLCFLR